MTTPVEDVTHCMRDPSFIAMTVRITKDTARVVSCFGPGRCSCECNVCCCPLCNLNPCACGES